MSDHEIQRTPVKKFNNSKKACIYIHTYIYCICLCIQLNMNCCAVAHAAGLSTELALSQSSNLPMCQSGLGLFHQKKMPDNAMYLYILLQNSNYTDRGKAPLKDIVSSYYFARPQV